MTHHLIISARDPVVARDGRPFGAGQGRRMQSVGWPGPSVVAGSFRTTLGKLAKPNFDDSTQEDLLKMSVAGVLPVANGNILLPPPADCVIEDKDGQFIPHAARPRSMAGGANWPNNDLSPVTLDDSVKDDFKPCEKGPTFWPRSAYVSWLVNGTVDLGQPGFLGQPRSDSRDHVAMSGESGTAVDTLLFSTSGVNITRLPPYPPQPRHRPFQDSDITLTARVSTLPAWTPATVSQWHPLGGERRLVHWALQAGHGPWECPKEIQTALANTTRVMMMLATPAIFAHGWLPTWMTSQEDGWPRLKLVGVCLHRWKAISGWAYAGKPGPKPIRRVVPAGSTYFFETDNSASLANRWLMPVSDSEQDRNDGFGLAAWGTWNVKGTPQ